ncbi:hypothetical protein HOLleu_13216 [Holothuria leucospilota]|uniref:PKD/REJ-like domain-containing protein n=1 Tax=Holothuria leucospilota TaxID=206669 RepID=A0A9Q1HEI5_HOLLE|nr:hypothetical protein HOLleu_13216 [Holothuria leucospilota]
MIQVTLRDEGEYHSDQRESEGWIKIEKRVGTSIVVDGSSSYDPDDSPVIDDDPLLTFSWSCQSESDSNTQQNSSNLVCDGSTLGTDPILTIKSDLITTPVSMEFHLFIRKDSRSAGASQTIHFIPGDVLPLAVR